MPHDKNHTKDGALGSCEEEEEARSARKGTVNGTNKKVGLSGCTHAIVQISLLYHKDSGSKMSAFAQYVEVQDALWKKTKKLLCNLKKGGDALNDSDSN